MTCTEDSHSRRCLYTFSVVGVVFGALAGYCIGFAHAEKQCAAAAQARTPAAECADRMNAAARECDKSGLVDFDRTNRDEIGNESKRLVCQRQTQTELKP